MQETLRKRKNWIDAAKAAAIFVVVLNHSGLIIPGVNFWGGMFFVPAFFVLSGYTYHTGGDSFFGFIKRKAKRILLPYLVANLLLFLFYFILRIWKKTAWEILWKQFVLTSLAGILYGRSCLFPENGDPHELMINLNAPMWFLPALFLALVITEGLFRIFREDEKKILAVILVYTLLGTGYHYICPLLLPWCLDMMPFFLLMMYAGYWLKKTNTVESFDTIPLQKRILAVTVLLLVLVTSGLINGSVNLSLSNTGKSVTLMLLSAVSSSVLLMLFMHRAEKSCEKLTELLAGIGRHTLTILCCHYFILCWSMEIGSVILSRCVQIKGRSACLILLQIMCILFSISACLLLDMLLVRLKQMKQIKP